MTDVLDAPAEQKEGLPLLTASRLRCFRECPRKHHYSYVEGWKPAVEQEALRFGSLIHRGLEAYWLGEDPALAVADRGIDVWEQIRAEELLLGYALRWRGTDTLEYETLAIEPEYRTELMNPATFAPSRTWRLAGKIDGILRRRHDGRTLVMEHKTTSLSISDDTDHYWETLSIDHQISGYVIGALSLGHEVDEILYDVIRKAGQRPLLATPVEDRKYTKKDGRLYAGQRETDETPEEYRARIREVIRSDLPKYYQRRAIPRTQSQLQEYLDDAWATSRTMREMELAGRAPRNPEACHRYGTCPYWSLCSTGAKPGEYPGEFVQVAARNPELSEVA